MEIVFLILLLIAAFVVLSVLTQFAVSLIIPILVWAFMGWLASRVVNGRGSGVLGNVFLGLVGGVIGGWLFQSAGFLAGTLGAVIVVVVVNLISGRRRMV